MHGAAQVFLIVTTLFNAHPAKESQYLVPGVEAEDAEDGQAKSAMQACFELAYSYAKHHQRLEGEVAYGVACVSKVESNS